MIEWLDLTAIIPTDLFTYFNCKQIVKLYDFFLKIIKTCTDIYFVSEITGEKIMSSINPINVNTQGIGGAFGFGAKAKPEEKEVKEKEEAKVSEQTPVSADEVLSFMAQSAISVKPTTAIDPSKYVDSESAARIAGFMADFEDKVAEGLAAFDQEFAGVDISDSAKMAVVLAGINKEA